MLITGISRWVKEQKAVFCWILIIINKMVFNLDKCYKYAHLGQAWCSVIVQSHHSGQYSSRTWQGTLDIPMLTINIAVSEGKMQVGSMSSTFRKKRVWSDWVQSSNVNNKKCCLSYP